MGRRFLIAATVLLLSAPCYVSAQRNLPGQKSIQVMGGTVDGFLLRNADREYSYFGSIAYVRSNRNQTRWVLGATYQQKDYTYKLQKLPKVQFTGEAGYYIPMLSDRGRNVCFSVGVSGLLGYETSN